MTRIAKDRQSKSVDDYYYNKNTTDTHLQQQTREQQKVPETITCAAKPSVNEAANYSAEITTGYEGVVTTPPGLINIKNTTIGSVTYSSGSTESPMFSSNYTSLLNLATGETKNSLKQGMLGASIKTTFDEGNEIGLGPIAF